MFVNIDVSSKRLQTLLRSSMSVNQVNQVNQNQLTKGYMRSSE